MPDLDNGTAVALAQFLAPYLLFDPSERFFPIVAEELLNHKSPEAWSSSHTHERGTAVLVADVAAATFADGDVRAGSHAPAGAHLTLTTSPPAGIGEAFPVTANQDLFLDVAGWADAASSPDPTATRFSVGSLDYLDLLFRGLSSQLNPALATEAPNPRPDFTIPRSTTPTMYAEVEWAGRYPRLDQARVTTAGGQADFPPAIGTTAPGSDSLLHVLDDYIAVTYYLLYPAMEPSPLVANDAGAVRKREGQWEAITVFVKARASDGRDEDGRPDFSVMVNGSLGSPTYVGGRDGLIGGQARFVAYSQGYGWGDDSDTPLAAEVRPLFSTSNPNLPVAIFGSHCLAYVTGGSHKNLFSTAAIVHHGDSPPNATLNPLGGAIMGAAGTAAGVCLGLAPPPLTPACIVCLIIAAVVFLIGLILFLLSFLIRDDPPVDEAPDPSSTDVARDGGGQSVPPGGSTVTVPGLQPSGNSVGTTLRIINRFKFDPTPPVDTYPLPTPDVAEFPSWWLFPGRWGVRTRTSALGNGDSGTRRTDAHERSRGYWNTYRLVEFLNDPARVTDGIMP
jgi:hypothetical protein